MRQKKAKRLRRQVYGDYSQRNPQYEINKAGTVRAIGLRAEYQKAKKDADGEKFA